MTIAAHLIITFLVLLILMALLITIYVCYTTYIKAKPFLTHRVTSIADARSGYVLLQGVAKKLEQSVISPLTNKSYLGLYLYSVNISNQTSPFLFFINSLTSISDTSEVNLLTNFILDDGTATCLIKTDEENQVWLRSTKMFRTTGNVPISKKIKSQHPIETSQQNFVNRNYHYKQFQLEENDEVLVFGLFTHNPSNTIRGSATQKLMIYSGSLEAMKSNLAVIIKFSLRLGGITIGFCLFFIFLLFYFNPDTYDIITHLL